MSEQNRKPLLPEFETAARAIAEYAEAIDALRAAVDDARIELAVREAQHATIQ